MKLAILIYGNILPSVIFLVTDSPDKLNEAEDSMAVGGTRTRVS